MRISCRRSSPRPHNLSFLRRRAAPILRVLSCRTPRWPSELRCQDAPEYHLRASSPPPHVAAPLEKTLKARTPSELPFGKVSVIDSFDSSSEGAAVTCCE
jgi:hypothetical protein